MGRQGTIESPTSRCTLSGAQDDRRRLPSDLDVEEVGYVALIVDVPAQLEVLDELRVERVLVARVVQDEEVVNVAPDDEVVGSLPGGGVDRSGEVEHAVVGLALTQSPLLEPGEQGPLPTAARLRHAVHWLDDFPYARAPVGAERAVGPGRGVAVDDLARFELALEVGRDKVPAAHAEAMLPGKRGEHAQRGAAQRRAVRLIKINALLLPAPLHAKARLELAVALPLVYPHELDEPTSARCGVEGGAVEQLERAVDSMVLELLELRGAPALGVVVHGLYMAARVGRRGLVGLRG